MAADIEFRNQAVRDELKRWGEWYLKEAPFGGVRLDAVKHMSAAFISEWLGHMRTLKPDLFAVGEYWAPEDLPAYGKQHDYFDAPNCIGWTREGVNEHPHSGCAVVLSNGEEAVKKWRWVQPMPEKYLKIIWATGPKKLVSMNRDGASFPYRLVVFRYG